MNVVYVSSITNIKSGLITICMVIMKIITRILITLSITPGIYCCMSCLCQKVLTCNSGIDVSRSQTVVTAIMHHVDRDIRFARACR